MSKNNVLKIVKKHQRIYFVAGEPSGDKLGASVMSALKQNPRNADISFVGIGGPSMENYGLKSLFPMSELSIMGLFELIPHIPNVLARLNQTLEDIKYRKPDLVVTIDSPGFNFRLGKKVKGLGIPVIHIGAPSVWAWKPWRAKKVAAFLDHLIALFPFEPPYFTKEGLATTFVGHPLVEKNLEQIDPKAFRETFQIPKDQKIIVIMPGSRQSEIQKLLPIFLDVLRRYQEQGHKFTCVCPTVPHLREKVESFLSAQGGGIVLLDETLKYQALRGADVALVASGTATLELALTQTPMIVAYKANAISAWIVKQLIKVKYVCLVNLLLDEYVIPEYLQENCTADKIYDALSNLLNNKQLMAKDQRKSLIKVQRLLTPARGSPSQNTADIIQSYLNPFS